MRENNMTAEYNTANESSEEQCPLCGGRNACGVRCAQPCWCVSVNVPADLIELVPHAAKGKACICRACVLRYNENPAAFVALIGQK